MLGIARSRSEKRITLPPNRWNRITSFHLLPRDGALLLRLPQRMWAYSVSASISPNALFRAYFLFYQCDAKLQIVQWHGGEYDDSRRTRTDCSIPGRRRGEGR